MSAITRTLFVALMATGLIAAAAPPSSATEIVKASLADKGAAMAMPTTLGMGMGANMQMATMTVELDRTLVKAGEITFEVTNNSKELIHELIVAPTSDPAKPLPFVDKDFRVDEEAAKDLGEVSELEPGKAGALTITLAPGTYVLYCNVAGHYMSGMWATITVE